tara:strand:+ start:96 stop:680 length:585 start_codon:yes stop_codon:yes gene_type:complete
LTEKGIRTRNHFIEVSAALFNHYGYAGTSVDTILDKAGYSKGALYRTFKDKEEIVVEAFKFNLKELGARMQKEIDKESTAKRKLNAMFRLYTDVILGKIFPNGCPLLNTSVEVDDTNDQMRLIASKAFDTWRDLIREILKEGIKNNEFDQNMDIGQVPDFIIATIEGSIAISKAQKNPSIVVNNIKMLKQILNF